MNKPINEQMESESVARPQADPKQNESFFIILIGLRQNIRFMYPVHKYLLRANYNFTMIFEKL